MSLNPHEVYKDPKWVDVKDLPSAFVKRKPVVVLTKRERLAEVIATLQPQPQHKDVLRSLKDEEQT